MTRPIFGDPAAIAAVRDVRKPEWVRALAKAGVSCPNRSTCGRHTAFSSYDASNDRATFRCLCGAARTVNNKGEVV